MLFVPTAQFLAAAAQRRHFAEARLDGPTVVPAAAAARFSIARLIGRRPNTVRSGAVLGRRQFA
jgi:hypothetical protein